MKRTVLAITAVMLITFVLSSSCMIINQSTHKTPKISDGKDQVINVETTENSKKTQENGGAETSPNQNFKINEEEIAKNMQGDNLNESSESSVDTSKNENPPTDIRPPDGRIYLNTEPPYAYVPTYTPKEWPSLPIIPPELGD